MEAQQSQPLDQREIRGVNIKMMIGFLTLLVTGTGTGIGYYNSLVSMIREVQWEKKSDDQIYRLKIETLEATVKAQGTQIQYLEQRVNRNAKSIEEK